MLSTPVGVLRQKNLIKPRIWNLVDRRELSMSDKSCHWRFLNIIKKNFFIVFLSNSLFFFCYIAAYYGNSWREPLLPFRKWVKTRLKNQLTYNNFEQFMFSILWKTISRKCLLWSNTWCFKRINKHNPFVPSVWNPASWLTNCVE